MRFAVGIFLLPLLSLWAAPPVPYYGKVSIDGINYHGSAQFQFSLEDANGTEHWRNGADANESIRVFVVNGRYSVMLGGQGMNPLPPELFLQHEELYLSVSFDTGDGPRSLGPEQLITATPRALVAEMAKVARVAERLSGEITSDMLSPEVLSKLDANQSAAPMGPITLDMLPAEVLANLNKSAPAITSITRDMLPADVLADLNKTAPVVGPITLSMLAPEVTAKLEGNASGGISGPITRDMLPADVLADLNKSAPAVGPITLSMLDAEVTAKLDSNTSGTTTVNNPPAVGSLIAIPYGESAPAGYSLYQQGTPKELVWEEKAPVSDARSAYDGVEVLDGKIYFVGGNNATGEKNIAERYDPDSNTWDTIASMSVARSGVASAVLNGKLYAIGGNGLSSVEVYDPSTNAWSTGPSLPGEVHMGAAISTNGMIYLIGGINSSNQVLNQVLSFDPSSNQWTPMANMPTARRGTGLAWFQNRIWVIGGLDDNPLKKVEVFNPTSNSWETETNLNFDRASPITWTWKNRLFSAGGWRAGLIHNTIEFYDFSLSEWKFSTSLPEGKSQAGAIVLNDKVYILAGDTAEGVYSNKVYAADLNASTAGVYDLYRKDGNASVGTPVVQAEVADGSVTSSKIASNTITTSDLSEQILKYLKPEITAQPQVKLFYADSNVSFSVSAEGKYLTYQWKKDGSDIGGETNATFTITDANSTLHDGNYSVVVSNDFGSVESGEVEFLVSSFFIYSIPNIELWLDSSDSSTITLNNGKVSIWHDKSGNENNATQSLASNQPEFGQDQNGKFVKFTSSYTNGDAHSVLADNYLIVPPISFKSSFFVIDHDGSKVSMLFGSQEHLKSYLIIGGNDFAISVDGYNNSSGPQDVGSWWYNGAFQDTGTDMGATGLIPLNTPSLHSVIYQLNDPMFSFHRIGSYRGNKAGFGGKIREVVIFDDYLNEPVRQKIEGYLAHKWGLTADLPSDHPYKNNAP